MENREIKFRGVAASNVMVFGDLITQGYYAEPKFGLIQCGIQLKSGYIERIPHRKTVGQFTGLTDKNGNDIYEGDIVECLHWEPSKYQIRFIEGGFCLCNNKGEWSGDVTHMEDSTGKHFSVIGNIHQHKHLLS